MKQRNTKEKKRMNELLKSEDLEMVNLGIQLMKHLCPRKQWENILLVAFSIMANGRYVNQRWDWQITDDKEISIKPEEIVNSWSSYGTATSTGSFWVYGNGAVCGTSTGGTVTYTNSNTLTVDNSTGVFST